MKFTRIDTGAVVDVQVPDPIVLTMAKGPVLKKWVTSAKDQKYGTALQSWAYRNGFEPPALGDNVVTEATTTVKAHTAHSKKGKVYNVKQYERQVFHGTTPANAEKILKQGIIPKKSNFTVFDISTQTDKKIPVKKVFVTSKEEDAKYWAKKVSGDDGGYSPFAVITVHVPKDKLTKDPNDPLGNNGFMTDKIDSKWIKSIKIYRTEKPGGPSKLVKVLKESTINQRLVSEAKVRVKAHLRKSKKTGKVSHVKEYERTVVSLNVDRGRLNAVNAAIEAYPAYLRQGLTEIKAAKNEGFRSQSHYLDGVVYISKNDSASGVGYTSSDMTGIRLVDSKYPAANAMGATVVNNLPAYLLGQVVAHEIGHHVMHTLPADLNIKAYRLFGKYGAKVSTHTTASYRMYFDDKKGEASSALSGFYDRRLASEAFAESMRLKATDTKNYKLRVPAILRKFIDGEIWKKR